MLSILLLAGYSSNKINCCKTTSLTYFQKRDTKAFPSSFFSFNNKKRTAAASRKVENGTPNKTIWKKKK
jgi:hypothetical protein